MVLDPEGRGGAGVLEGYFAVSLGLGISGDGGKAYFGYMGANHQFKFVAGVKGVE